MKQIQVITVTTEQANKIERWLACYSDNIYRKDHSEAAITEFHLVADATTMKRIVREVEF